MMMMADDGGLIKEAAMEGDMMEESTSNCFVWKRKQGKTCRVRIRVRLLATD